MRIAKSCAKYLKCIKQSCDLETLNEHTLKKWVYKIQPAGYNGAIMVDKVIKVAAARVYLNLLYILNFWQDGQTWRQLYAARNSKKESDFCVATTITTCDRLWLDSLMKEEWEHGNLILAKVTMILLIRLIPFLYVVSLVVHRFGRVKFWIFFCCSKIQHVQFNELPRTLMPALNSMLW